VKNSLNGLKAATSLLSRGQDPELPVRSIRGEVDRLAHLASSLLHFGRPQAPRTQEVDLDSLVDEVLEGIKVLPECDDVTPTRSGNNVTHVVVRADPLLLATALHNLVRNAVEAAVAAKDTGRVQDPRVDVRVEVVGAHARVIVDDTAGGIDPDIAARLFLPFVTGKPKGIGLGLTMARRAVEDQGFTLRYENVAGGTRFVIEMPTHTPIAAPPVPA
jgi:signal transduction histidine kinase